MPLLVVLVSPLAVGGAGVYSTTFVAGVVVWSGGAAISPWAWAGSSSGALRGTWAPGGAMGMMSGGESHPMSPHATTPAGTIRIRPAATPLRCDLIDSLPVDGRRVDPNDGR